jgi:bifunctional ADP-heptose synthase (sugar kinase/adenylyltransferase)
MRSKIISGLEIVDYVYINFNETPINLIKKIKPKYYCKGKDYKNKSDDLTKNIFLEEKEIKKNNGKLKIIDTDLQSSSSILNNYFINFTNEQKNIIKKCKTYSSGIKDIFNDLENKKACIIGEIIFDEYIFCQPENLSTKSPTVSSKYINKETYFGGSLAIARSLKELGLKVDLFTYCKKNEKNSILNKKDKNLEINIFNLETDFPTPKKTRFIDKSANQKMFEIFDINSEGVRKINKIKFINQLQKRFKKYDIIYVADFGHGLLDDEIISIINNFKGKVVVNAQTNSENYGYNLISKYKNMDYFSIDKREAQLALGKKINDVHILYDEISKKIKSKNFSITLGKNGSISKFGRRNFVKCPAFFDKVVDATGSGDLFFTISSLLVKKNINPYLIAFISNIYAGLHTKVQGNSSVVNKIQLIKFITTLLK